MGKETEKEYLNGLMVQFTKDSSKKDRGMDQGHSRTPTETSTMGSLRMISTMEKESINTRMAEIMKDSGKMENKMAKE